MFSDTNRAVQLKTVSSLKFWVLESIEIIRIYLEFVDKIDNSRGPDLSILSTNECWILFLAYFKCKRFNKASFTSKYPAITSAILNKTDVFVMSLNDEIM